MALFMRVVWGICVRICVRICMSLICLHLMRAPVRGFAGTRECYNQQATDHKVEEGGWVELFFLHCN